MRKTNISSDQASRPTLERGEAAKEATTPPPTTFKRIGQPQRWWLIIALFAVGNMLFTHVFFPQPKPTIVSYTFFKQQVVAGNVESLSSIGDALEGRFKHEVVYPPAASVARTRAEAPKVDSINIFKTQRPSFADAGLESLLDSKGVVLDAADQRNSSWFDLILTFGPTLLLVAVFVWISRRGAGGGLFSLGRSRAKRYGTDQQAITFDDVAGIDEAENELKEVVDFLKHPDKYERLGGTVPKGVLLVGAPGTGKTLLARAVAGQAGVPFFSMSASEFIEMIVGVGAARVRDLFKEARAAAPSIIFIDELDAIGRARGRGSQMGGHDEREQTLNQILTEMDGFDAREGVIVLAATNRADVLDLALLRPGRFDRRVVVQRPDRAGRAAILAIHAKRVPLADDISLDSIAQETPGLVGAELRNLVNEAALLAARRNGDKVAAEDFAEAMQKITLGPARNILLKAADRRRTAYHEAGHTLLALLVTGSDPVHRVSIVPRGMALGATYQLPIDDRTSYGEDYLHARITGALGGRAAERLIYGVVTSGAENDLQQVTDIARHMVLRWGMSDKLGPISFVSPQDEGLPPAFQQQAYSEATAELIDAEVRRIVDDSHQEAERLLALHRDKLDALAEALLLAESMNAAEIYAAVGLPQPLAAT